MDIGKSNENLKTGSLSASIATSMGIWQRNEKPGHIARDCKGKQTMKKRKVQEESDDKDDKKEEQGFGKDLK